MKIILSFLIFVAIGSLSIADDITDKDLTDKVGAVIEKSATLKPGMTRADLLKIYTVEGGISTLRQRRFAYRSCPYIKVDVEFNLTKPDQKIELPTDTIVTISKPYLQLMILD